MKIKSVFCFLLTLLIFSTCFMAFSGEEASAAGALLENIKEPIKVPIQDFPIKDKEEIEDDLGSSLPNLKEDKEEIEIPTSSFPSQYCLRDEYILFAQHQDKHGYCWNFAATMAAATTIMKATNEYYDFSELWLGLAAYNCLSSYNKVGDGGSFTTQYNSLKTSGLMLESDLPYVESFIMTNENAEGYYNFYNEYSNDDLADSVTYDSSMNYSRKNVEEIKKHIYENGSLYMTISFRSGFVDDGNGVYYLTPNQKNTNSLHAISVIGWDDNYQKELYLNGSDTPTTFKGAWIILNSYTETSGTDGISFVFYDDTNVGTIQGYKYAPNTEKDLYFYDKIENGYAYISNVIGKYCGDFVAKTGETKQKNIFYNDVSLEYSYVISEGASVKGVKIYLGGVDVTSKFTVNIDNDAKRFYISGDNADYGQYKVIVTYGNSEKTDTYLNNFFVTHGLVGETVEYDNEKNDVGFNTGRDLELYSYISPSKNYVIYTNKTTGEISFVPMHQSVYSEMNMSIPSISYEITNGEYKTKYSIIANTGYVLDYNFTIEYHSDTSLLPVYVYYDLGGGVNNPKNYSMELANESTDLTLYAPSREGYTFAGWYLDYGNGSRKIESDGDAYYVDWDDITHMGESPTLFSSSYYKKYYNNSSVVFVYAHWEEVEYHTVNLAINGSGSSTMGETALLSGEDSARYIFTPSGGWCLSDLKIDGTSVSRDKLIEIASKGLLIENPTKDIEIEATFSQGTLIFLNVGENIKNAYLVGASNLNGQRYYDGDLFQLPMGAYAAYFLLVVEVYDDTDTHTYVLDNISSYTAIEKGVFSKRISISRNDKYKQITVDSATPKPKEDVTVTYTVNRFVADHYISADKDATSGTQNAATFTAGDVVYLFIKAPANTVQYEYYEPDEFESIGRQWYRKAVYVNADKANLGTFEIDRYLREYKITWKNWDGTVIYYEYYEYGDTPVYYYEDQYKETSHPVRPDDKHYTYTFESWTPSVGTVVGNATYQAVYSSAPKQFTVNFDVTEGGTVKSLGETNSLTHFDSLTYLITPEEGYKIKDVLVNGESLGAVLSYTFKDVEEDQVLRVEFEKIKHSVNVIVGENGSADFVGSKEVDYGSDLTLNITPSELFQIDFIKVNGKSESVSSALTITIKADTIIEIAFKQTVFEISTSSSENGTVTPSARVEKGGSQTVEFSPSLGYKIKDVKIDGVSIGIVSSYTFENVDKNHTVSVEYEIIKINLLLNIDGKGSVTPNNPLDNVSYGENRTLSFLAESGWTLANVFVDGKLFELQNGQLIIENVTSDIDVLVIFEEEKSNVGYIIAVSALSLSTIVSIIIMASLKTMPKRKYVEIPGVKRK